MNNKAPLYVIVAIAVGYVLISALPVQLSMYADERQLLSSQPPGQFEDKSPEPEGGILGTSNSTINDSLGIKEDNSSLTHLKNPELDVTGHPDRTVIDYMSMYKWWLLDLVIAFAVYFTAKKIFF